MISRDISSCPCRVHVNMTLLIHFDVGPIFPDFRVSNINRYNALLPIFNNSAKSGTTLRMITEACLIFGGARQICIPNCNAQQNCERSVEAVKISS